MTREEYLKWYKQRALEYVAAGDLEGALNSMMSDLRKHDETKENSKWPFTALGRIAAKRGDPKEMVRFINGFN